MGDARVVRVRRGRPADLPDVADVFLACWHQSYAAFLPPETAARFDRVGALELWRPHVEPRCDPGIVVADLDGSVVGVALVRADAAYLASLYVDPSRQGLGVGRRLLEAAVERCARAGARRLTWWVFTANEAGRSFYERLGARPTGTTREDGGYALPETEYELTW